MFKYDYVSHKRAFSARRTHTRHYAHTHAHSPTPQTRHREETKKVIKCIT